MVWQSPLEINWSSAWTTDAAAKLRTPSRSSRLTWELETFRAAQLARDLGHLTGAYALSVQLSHSQVQGSFAADALLDGRRVEFDAACLGHAQLELVDAGSLLGQKRWAKINPISMCSSLEQDRPIKHLGGNGVSSLGE